jgi:hypothetical protein
MMLGVAGKFDYGSAGSAGNRLTGLGARPLNEIKLPPQALPPGVAAVRQTTFADPEGNEFDLVTWQQQPA